MKIEEYSLYKKIEELYSLLPESQQIYNEELSLIREANQLIRGEIARERAERAEKRRQEKIRLASGTKYSVGIYYHDDNPLGRTYDNIEAEGFQNAALIMTAYSGNTGFNLKINKIVIYLEDDKTEKVFTLNFKYNK